MLKLMINEYQKIFLKKGTYFLLILVIFGSLAYQLITKLGGEADYGWTPDKEYIENELAWAKEYEDDASTSARVKVLEKGLEFGVYDLEYYGDNISWQGRLLSDAYYYFYPMILESTDPEATSHAQEMLAKTDEAVKSGDYMFLYTFYLEDYFNSLNGADKLFDYLIKDEIEPVGSNWKFSLVLNALDSLSTIQSYDENDLEPDKTYNKAKNDYEIAIYRLDNNTEYAVTDAGDYDYDFLGNKAEYLFASPFWNAMNASSGMLILMCIMMIIIAGGIIASEFSQGTIKFLLINPVSRSKIYFSKYFTVLTLTLTTSVAVFIINFVIALILGSDGIGAQYITYSAGKVVTSGVLPIVLKAYLYGLIEYVIIITLAFMISSLLRSNAVAIGVSLGTLFIGNTITTLLAVFGYDWGRYLVFANWDITSIASGNSLYPHMTVTGALITLLIYLVIFILTGHDGFTRKEV